MEQKPTYREYLFSGRYIKTKDGRFFTTERPSRASIVVVLYYLFFIGLRYAIGHFVIPWGFEVEQDICVLMIIPGIFVILPFAYRFERFKRIEPGSEEYQKATAKSHVIWKYIMIVLLTGMVVFICMEIIPGSYGLAYLRSLMDTPKAEYRISADGTDAISLSTEDGNTAISMPRKAGGEVRMMLNTWRTSETAQLTLDGEPVDLYDEGRDAGFWLGSDYLSQKYECEIAAGDIKDGSVLELICGTWRYEWTIDLKET